jgi:hypothetical protein
MTAPGEMDLKMRVSVKAVDLSIVSKDLTDQPITW